MRIYSLLGEIVERTLKEFDGSIGRKVIGIQRICEDYREKIEMVSEQAREKLKAIEEKGG